MAKVKFEAEDFKKDSNTSQINSKPNHLQKYWKWYGGAVAAACIAGAVILWPKGEVTPPTPPTVVDSLENFVDSSAVVRSDTLTTITEEPTANVDNPANTEAKPVNEEQKNPETEIVNIDLDTREKINQAKKRKTMREK